MIYDTIYWSTAVVLTPGGSSTVHIYTHKCGPCPVFCKFFPGICLTTEEKARKNLSQGSQRVLVYILPKRTHYKTHTCTHPHITKPTHIHTHTSQKPHIHTPTHYKLRSPPENEPIYFNSKKRYLDSEMCVYYNEFHVL